MQLRVQREFDQMVIERESVRVRETPGCNSAAKRNQRPRLHSLEVSKALPEHGSCRVAQRVLPARPVVSCSLPLAARF